MWTFLQGVVTSIKEKDRKGQFRDGRTYLSFTKELIEAYASPEETSIMQAVPEMDTIVMHADITSC